MLSLCVWFVLKTSVYRVYDVFPNPQPEEVSPTPCSMKNPQAENLSRINELYDLHSRIHCLLLFHLCVRNSMRTG